MHKTLRAALYGVSFICFVSSGMYGATGDSIDNDIRQNIVVTNTWTSMLEDGYNSASVSGQPIFIFWSAQTAYSLSDRQFLCKPSFKELLGRHDGVYLLYADITKKHVRDFKRMLFTQIGEYDGFLKTLNETGADHIVNLPQQSEYSLIYVDQSRVRFLFHILEEFQYKGTYDPSLSYRYNPYHSEIKIGSLLFRHDASYTDDGSDSYDYPFLYILDEYLSTRVPDFNACNANSNGIFISLTPFVRFAMPVFDQLYKDELETVIGTNQFTIEKSGCWFIDQDDILRCKRPAQDKSDSTGYLILTPKVDGTLCLGSEGRSNLFLMTAIDSTNDTTIMWSRPINCLTNVILRYTDSMKIKLYGNDVRITTFNTK